MEEVRGVKKKWDALSYIEKRATISDVFSTIALVVSSVIFILTVAIAIIT